MSHQSEKQAGVDASPTGTQEAGETSAFSLPKPLWRVAEYDRYREGSWQRLKGIVKEPEMGARLPAFPLPLQGSLIKKTIEEQHARLKRYLGLALVSVP